MFTEQMRAAQNSDDIGNSGGCQLRYCKRLWYFSRKQVMRFLTPCVQLHIIYVHFFMHLASAPLHQLIMEF